MNLLDELVQARAKGMPAVMERIAAALLDARPDDVVRAVKLFLLQCSPREGGELGRLLREGSSRAGTTDEPPPLVGQRERVRQLEAELAADDRDDVRALEARRQQLMTARDVLLARRARLLAEARCLGLEG